MPTTAAVRHRTEKRGVRPNGQIACRIGHCAIPVELNGGPAALLCRNLTTHTSPDDRAVRTPSGQAPSQIPIDRPGARHHRATPARGFLPRGFSDACRPSPRPRSLAAGIQEALTTPATCARRDEWRDLAHKPGVRGGRGELLRGVESGSSRFARPVVPLLEKQPFAGGQAAG